MPGNKRKKLLTLALKATNDGSFFAPLICDLASFNDLSSGTIIKRWRNVPSQESFMPSDAIELFIVVHIALERLKYPL